MPKPRVVAIYIADTREMPMKSVHHVRAVPGRGLDGDRYFKEAGTFSRKDGGAREVTLIENEALEALRNDYGVELEPGQSRRNIITTGVALNHLVGRQFSLGKVMLRGIKLCEPCSHLERLSKAGVRKGLIHRGGLRAQILNEGTIHVGDEIGFE